MPSLTFDGNDGSRERVDLGVTNPTKAVAAGKNKYSSVREPQAESRTVDRERNLPVYDLPRLEAHAESAKDFNARKTWCPNSEDGSRGRSLDDLQALTDPRGIWKLPPDQERIARCEGGFFEMNKWETGGSWKYHVANKPCSEMQPCQDTERDDDE